MERERERFFPTAGLAMLVGIVLGPPFLLSGSEPGEVGLAIAPVAIALAAALVCAFGAPGTVSTPAIGALLIGPAVATTFLARGATDRTIACATGGLPYDAPTPVIALIAAVLLAAGGARAATLGSRDPRVRTAVRAIALALVAGAIAVHVIALARGEAATPSARLAQLRPTEILEVMIEDGEQVAWAGGLRIARACDGGICELVVRAGDHPMAGAGSRRPLSDEIDRMPLGVVELPGHVAIAPMPSEGRLEWSRAMAFRASARPDDLSALDLGGAIRPPPSWRIASWIGSAIALACALLAIRARRRHARVDAGTEAIVDRDGVIHLDRGGLARPARALDAGPIVILRRAIGRPSYRDEGLPTVVDAIPGTRALWRHRLAERALGLELCAIGAVLLTHAPLFAAWRAGYAVLGG